MYICNDCGLTFENPKSYIDTGRTILCCPCCGSDNDVETAVECAECHKDFAESDISDGVCDECKHKIKSKLKDYILSLSEEAQEWAFDYLGIGDF